MFDNMKLRGRIREILGTECELARILGLKKPSMSLRLNGGTQFKRNEILKAAQVLRIPQEEIGLYFFTLMEDTEQ